TLPFPPFLPTSDVGVFGVQIQYGQIIVIITGVVLSGALYGFVQKTEPGAAMRGVVDDPSLLALTGRAPSRVRLWSWIIGSAFAALSGGLLAPSLGRDAFLLPLLVVQAFGAAAVGRFSSLPWTFGGGILLGVASSLMAKYVATSDSALLRGLPTSTPFLILF